MNITIILKTLIISQKESKMKTIQIIKTYTVSEEIQVASNTTKEELADLAIAYADNMGTAVYEQTIIEHEGERIYDSYED